MEPVQTEAPTSTGAPPLDSHGPFLWTQNQNCAQDFSLSNEIPSSPNLAEIDETSLLTSRKEPNGVWGDFIPYKDMLLVVTPQSPRGTVRIDC